MTRPNWNPGYPDMMPGDSIPTRVSPMVELGVTGLRRIGGYVEDEFLPQLRGRKAVQVYREMADNSAIVSAWLMTLRQLLRQLEWRVEPASSSAEDRANAELVEQNMNDMEHCYDDQTEVLTRRGWVSFADLTGEDQIAQRNPNGQLEYVLPSARQVFDFDGDLMGSSGNAVDFRVTPNHRMLFAPRTGRRFDSKQKHNQQIYRCEDIYGKTGWLTKQVEWEGVSTGRSKDWLEFLGFALADGSVAGGRSVVLIQKDRTYTEDLLLRCGLSEQVSRREVNGSTQWTLHRAALARELIADFGRVSREKRLPRWLLEATPEEQGAFLRGFTEGDGWTSPSGLVALFTSSKQLSDDLQILAMKAGYAATVLTMAGADNSFAPGLPKYRVSLWAREEHLNPQLKAGRSWLKEAYTGKVYCVSVPSGVIMVRRNGKAMWCGNSWGDMVTEALSMVIYGWSNHELVFKRRQGLWAKDPRNKSRYDDNKIAWRKVPIRAQETLLRWIFAENGDIEAMVQLSPPFYQTVVLPMTKCLLFRPLVNKGNPEGYSYLRPMWRSWFMIKRLEEIEATGAERDLTGLPKATMPAEYLAAAPGTKEFAMVQAIKKLVTTVRRNEQEGIVWPAAFDPDTKQALFEFELMTSGGSRQFDLDAVIQRYETRMLMSVMADFIMTGHEDNGASYALHTDKSGIFRTGLNALADAIADPFNRQAIPQLFALNGMKPKELPRIVPNDVDPPDLTQLSAFMTALAGTGLQWFPDPELEQFVRDAARLPKLDKDVEKVREVEQRQAAVISLATQRLQEIQISQQADQGQAQADASKLSNAQSALNLHQQAQQAASPEPEPGADPTASDTAAQAKETTSQATVGTQRQKVGLDTDKTKLAQERERLLQLRRGRAKADSKTPTRNAPPGRKQTVKKALDLSGCPFFEDKELTR